MSVRLIIAGIFLILGLFMYCVCVLGLFRFNNVLDRMHAAAVGDTMGMFLTIAGLVILSNNFFSGCKTCMRCCFYMANKSCSNASYRKS